MALTLITIIININKNNNNDIETIDIIVDLFVRPNNTTQYKKEKKTK
jgi:hypothetical protein